MSRPCQVDMLRERVFRTEEHFMQSHRGKKGYGVERSRFCQHMNVVDFP